MTPANSLIQAFSDYGITPSLNAYSFNRALLEEGMSLEELFIFAARIGFSSLDLTAYYIPGYPEVPDDDALYEIKRMAFRTGISPSQEQGSGMISPCGIRKRWLGKLIW